jgi:hypothetical protein
MEAWKVDGQFGERARQSENVKLRTSGNRKLTRRAQKEFMPMPGYDDLQTGTLLQTGIALTRCKQRTAPHSNRYTRRPWKDASVVCAWVHDSALN